MPTEHTIAATEFCTHYQIELSFVQSLHHSGLLPAESSDNDLYIPLDAMPTLEKMVRLRYDMGINLEGIETITYLLQQLTHMQQQVIQLQNKLSIYE